MFMNYIVYYIDDFCKRHITFATSMAEVNFIKDRFTQVDFEKI